MNILHLPQLLKFIVILSFFTFLSSCCDETSCEKNSKGEYTVQAFCGFFDTGKLCPYDPTRTVDFLKLSGCWDGYLNSEKNRLNIEFLQEVSFEPSPIKYKLNSSNPIFSENSKLEYLITYDGNTSNPAFETPKGSIFKFPLTMSKTNYLVFLIEEEKKELKIFEYNKNMRKFTVNIGEFQKCNNK